MLSKEITYFNKNTNLSFVENYYFVINFLTDKESSCIINNVNLIGEINLKENEELIYYFSPTLFNVYYHKGFKYLLSQITEKINSQILYK